MAVNNITGENLFNQVFKDGDKINNKDVRVDFVRDLINENAYYENGVLTLYVHDLSFDEKKIFLSIIVEPEDYEYYCQSQTRLEAAIQEYTKAMQKRIDDIIDDVWHENMQEMGLVLSQHQDNGEYFYRRR